MSQQNKTTLQSAINTQLADNTSGDISAADVRDNLINMTDSLLFNSGSQGITGSLTATSFTGSLQGTASYAVQALSASYVPVAQTLVDDNLPLVLISGSSLVKDQSNSIIYNPSTNTLNVAAYTHFTGSVSSLDGFTGSLQGTASYATVAQTLLGSVTSASYAATTSIADVATKLTITGAGGVGPLYPTLVGISAGDLNVSTKVSNLSFNQTTNQLFATSISSSFTGSLQGTASYATVAETLLGSVTSASYAATASVLLGSVTSASYAATSSLSEATIGAGDLGSIQFKGGTGPGSPEGKNTYSSTFTWNVFNSGLNIGDPNTTGGYGTGDYYIAVGYDALAAGFAAAFGSSSYAQGEGSFTHGKTVTAAGTYAHAEGTNTQAQGNFSHAEGNLSTTWGVGSHAEGNNTTANGDYSHTEGASTTTNGYGSHAEGANTLASASYSHAEGRFTVSRGQYSHAEGFYATASGIYSHAEGSGSVAVGVGSHAEGQFTIASGSYQHVQGRFNTQGDNTSLMIVGNGIDNNNRSDAFKVRQSGSIVLPTTQSTAPSWTGADGEMVFATVTGAHYFYVWMAGAWRSGSLS